MCYDAAYLMCVMELYGTDLVIVATMLDRGFQGINLSKEAHCCVIEETAYDSGALDEPVHCQLRCCLPLY